MRIDFFTNIHEIEHLTYCFLLVQGFSGQNRRFRRAYERMKGICEIQKYEWCSEIRGARLALRAAYHLNIFTCLFCYFGYDVFHALDTYIVHMSYMRSQGAHSRRHFIRQKPIHHIFWRFHVHFQELSQDPWPILQSKRTHTFSYACFLAFSFLASV